MRDIGIGANLYKLLWAETSPSLPLLTSPPLFLLHSLPALPFPLPSFRLTAPLPGSTSLPSPSSLTVSLSPSFFSPSFLIQSLPASTHHSNLYLDGPGSADSSQRVWVEPGHFMGLYQNGPSPKRPIAKTAPKILISKKIVQNGPLHCPKRPIIQPKRPIAKSKTAHGDIQNGPLSLSAFGNVQSDPEILYVEASYTRVRGLDDSETVKSSAMHYGVTCSKFKSVNGSTVCKIATQHFPHKSHTNLIINHNLKSASALAYASRWSEHVAASMYQLRVARTGRQHWAPASCRQSTRMPVVRLDVPRRQQRQRRVYTECPMCI